LFIPVKSKICFRSKIFSLLLGCLFGQCWAGGGLVIEDDACIIKIDFYSAHFTAYQPATSGEKQFCQELPETGLTLFVLDYLHQSLKEVPVDFRIIRDVTGQGQFVKLKHVEELGDLGQHTVFYQPPLIRTDGSFQVEHEFTEPGTYIGIVSAGHPSNPTLHTAAFSFTVGSSNLSILAPLVLLLAGTAFIFVRRMKKKNRMAAGETDTS
jgi:hypothetical protein